MIQKSDQRLVKRFLRSQSETAFTELYRRHTPALYAFALRLCGGSEADAEDIIQDTWIRACTALCMFQWKSTLRTWLTGVLINCVRELNRRRESQPEEQLPDDRQATNVVLPGATAALEQAIARLPTGYRCVLALHDLEGYTHKEIGALMDINIGTSKSQLHQARKAIRAILQTEQKSQ